MLETIDAVAKLSAYTLLVAALIGGYFQLWYYGPAVRQQIAEWKDRCAKSDARAEKLEELVRELLVTTKRVIRREEIKTRNK